MKYASKQVTLHWLVAILIILQFILHEPIHNVYQARLEGISFEHNIFVFQHIIGGLLIFVLAILRLQQRFKVGVPPLPEQETALMKAVAHIVHYSLYGLMLLMPISGAAAWFGGIEAAANTHANMKFILIALFFMHVGAALFHQYILKNGLMRRMWY